MSATATAILHWNALPVFSDIESNYFCLDIAALEKNITPYTKAIIAVDIFGHSADMNAIMSVASKHGLKVVSDSAQAPGAMYKGRYAGTIANVGGYSLNYHKHIHTGEGGILVTDDEEIANKARLIRNHGEAVVGDMGRSELANMVGYNMRLGEIECAWAYDSSSNERLYPRILCLPNGSPDRHRRGESYDDSRRTDSRGNSGCVCGLYQHTFITDVSEKNRLWKYGVSVEFRVYKKIHLL
jgi:hypothetical protein